MASLDGLACRVAADRHGAYTSRSQPRRDRVVTCMELKLHRPRAACTHTGRPFAAGEPFVSALIRSEGRLDRRDYAVAAWNGPPDHTLAWWRSTYPATTSDGTSLAPADVLLDVLEELEGREDEAALRYLVALELVRRRAVRFLDRHGDDQADSPADGGAPVLILVCRKRDREYRIRSVSQREATAPGVEERLAALLWSGGAA